MLNIKAYLQFTTYKLLLVYDMCTVFAFRNTPVFASWNHKGRMENTGCFCSLYPKLHYLIKHLPAHPHAHTHI